MITEVLMCAALLTAPACAASSMEAKDWKGYEPSLYTGQHYHHKWAKVRKCIMHRESRSNYRARGTISTASGAYQFLDSQWRISLTYMMIRESRSTADGLISDIKELRQHRSNIGTATGKTALSTRHGITEGALIIGTRPGTSAKRHVSPIRPRSPRRAWSSLYRYP